VALWGQAGSADVAGAASRIAEIRAELEPYPAERIYNMDETGLFYRCIPNRAYVQAGQRRQARGTKAMKAKERITLVLACNATGNHKIPVAIIGKAKEPLCFNPPRRPSPLSYFSQKSAWMDSDIFKSWFETCLLAGGEGPHHSTGCLGVGQLWGTRSTRVQPSHVYCASTELYIHLSTAGPGDNRLSEKTVQAAAVGPGRLGF